MVWHGMVWCGVVWCGVVKCGVVWQIRARLKLADTSRVMFKPPQVVKCPQIDIEAEERN